MNLAQNDLARLFVFEDQTATCNKPWAYMSAVSMDGLSQDRDVTKFEAPSDAQLGEFDEVAVIPGELSRLTTSLTGRLSRTELSTFRKLFAKQCPIDLHLHFGLCQRPDSFSEYDKALVFENVYITSFGTDPLVALQSGDRNVINETIDISIGRYYEVVPLTYTSRSSTVVATNDALIDVLFVDLPTCGTCGTKSDGCQRAVTVSSDGYVYLSEDGGLTWVALAQPVDILAAALALPVAAVAFQGDLLIVTSAGVVWRANLNDLFDGTVTVWDTSALAGISVADMAQYNNKVVVVVGTTGDIQYFNQYGDTATVAENGTLVTSDIKRVAVGPTGTFVAATSVGAVVYSEDGAIWQLASAVPAVAVASAVMVKGPSNFEVGFASGALYCTSDAGKTWTQIKYPGYASGLGAIKDLSLATNHVAYLAQGTRVLRSIDGGVTWTVQPDSRQTMPTVTAFAAVAGCGYDPNRVIAVGEASVAGTGVVVVGSV
jgi:photosystem II stability/assembly factor-like uncharacterized protein